MIYISNKLNADIISIWQKIKNFSNFSSLIDSTSDFRYKYISIVILIVDRIRYPGILAVVDLFVDRFSRCLESIRGMGEERRAERTGSSEGGWLNSMQCMHLVKHRSGMQTREEG